ncbi:DNA-binding protein [Sphaerotilus microaerophilus]|uniref:DNA-binding protein n=1 Tax=Sphaerotilus microaerophilus TaxID=2914710 RepID=A0ABM7YKL8_9BURK|nr:DNA-binding protein [Sphaerotilus sp. FB-5]BDI04974.1 hypothetical protein CATMQ487_19440 [Sphaerotilus sp. FB-5]
MQNLLGRTLELVAPDRAQVVRLLAALARNLADAQLQGLSAENRFDAAYKSIMQLAMLALHAHGYRPRTSVPGHHQTAIQCLTLTINLPPATVRLLDALRKQRNLSDYSGDLVPESAVVDCVAAAGDLQRQLREWLGRERPELL